MLMIWQKTTCNPTTPTEQQFSSNKNPANLEQIVKTVESQPIKTVKPPQLEKTMEPPKPAKTVEPQPPAKTVESAKAKICAKNNLSNLDMIPLGKILKYISVTF
jgi:hypothetical protein